MATTIQLTNEELKTVLEAIAAVTPSGGGSRIHTLYRKLLEQSPHLPDSSRVLAFQENAHREFTGE